MAVRPVFVASRGVPAFQEVCVQFTWHSGFARSQKEKSIWELHGAFARDFPDLPLLEVSGKSSSALGVSLSAFNLLTDHPTLGSISVESAFQGSKVFADLGQIELAYETDPRTAKSIAREADSEHALLRFSWKENVWPLEPKSLFYDWLYCSSLSRRPQLIDEVRLFRAFTDIEFNPEKSFNCQARSCAIAVSLIERGLLNEALENRQTFLGLVYGDNPPGQNPPEQLSLV